MPATSFVQPAEKASEPTEKENSDQRVSQETDNAVEVAVAVDEASNVDSEERIKLERRRRRCPIVRVEKYLKNEDDEEEKKENEAAGSNRYLSYTQNSLLFDCPAFAILCTAVYCCCAMSLRKSQKCFPT